PRGRVQSTRPFVGTMPRGSRLLARTEGLCRGRETHRSILTLYGQGSRPRTPGKSGLISVRSARACPFSYSEGCRGGMRRVASFSFFNWTDVTCLTYSLKESRHRHRSG